MTELTKIEKIKLGTVEIAKRKQLKTEFSNCKFSVMTEQYTGGSSININLMKADKKIVKDIKLSMPFTMPELENFGELLEFNWDEINNNPAGPGDEEEKKHKCPNCGFEF